MTDLPQARALAASAYPVALTDSLGRPHENVVRKAILAGRFDHGRIVQQHMEKNCG